MVDYRRPFDLWVWGMSYTQKHLTDGFIPTAALPRGADKAAQTLVARRLWEVRGVDFQIHDYHQWNDSRETVLAKRSSARDRAKKSRDSQHQRAPHGAGVTTPHSAGGDVGSNSLSSLEGVQGKPSAPTPHWPGNSNRAMYRGRNFTVLEWQVDRCMQTLASHSDTFGLDDWFQWLDNDITRQKIAVNPKKFGDYLHERLLLECRTRGIPIAGESSGVDDSILAEIRRQDAAVRQ